MPKRKSAKSNGNGSGANLGFDATLWFAADKMRNNMDAAEYNAGIHWNIGVLSGAHSREQLAGQPHSHLLTSVSDLSGIWPGE